MVYMGTFGLSAQTLVQRVAPITPQSSTESFLASRRILTLVQREPSFVLERIGAAGSSLESPARTALATTTNIFGAGGSQARSPIANEVLVRQGRHQISTLAAEQPVLPRPLPPIEHELDARPFVMALRELVRSDKILEARYMLRAAPAHILSDPLLAQLGAALAPPVVSRVRKLDRDRSEEFEWLRIHGPEHRGRWVALVGDDLLASAPTLRELQERLAGIALLRPPLLQRID